MGEQKSKSIDYNPPIPLLHHITWPFWNQYQEYHFPPSFPLPPLSLSLTLCFFHSVFHFTNFQTKTHLIIITWTGEKRRWSRVVVNLIIRKLVLFIRTNIQVYVIDPNKRANGPCQTKLGSFLLLLLTNDYCIGEKN